MLRKLLLISLFLGSSFGTGALASTDNRSQDEVINAIYNQLEEGGYLQGMNSADEDTVLDVIKTEVEDSFARVQAGELSLETDANNYFLLDTISKVVKGITKVVKKIGGKVFNAIKGALGTVLDVGLKFLSKIDSDFIKMVIGPAADALGVLIAGSGEALAAASLLIPVAGEVIAPVVATLAPFATMVINSDTASLAADAIGMASRKVLEMKDKDIDKGFAAAHDAKGGDEAPKADNSLDSLSKKRKDKDKKTSSSSSSKSHKETFTKHFAKACHGLMKFLGGLTADKYNSQPTKIKQAGAQCNHFVGSVNTVAAKK